MVAGARRNASARPRSTSRKPAASREQLTAQRTGRELKEGPESLLSEAECDRVRTTGRPDLAGGCGTKEVVALEDGYRESTESWLALLRDLKERGMRAPVVAVGDGALGFWAAIREVFPETCEERCWVHKIANVIDKLPKSLQPKAKAALHEMMNAPTKVECEKLVDAFVTEHEAKYPKAAKALATESDKLMTHFELPAEHWKHLRTTNPIESTFATVKLRQRVTKGAGSRGAALAMAHRLLLLAERTWRRLDGHELLPLVRAGVKFKDGAQVERNDGAANKGKRGKIAA